MRTPTTADAVRSCRQHIFEALTQAMATRGNGLKWIEGERRAVAMAANAWALAHGGRTVTVDDVKRVEGMAVGHVDYASKLTLYVAELVVRGPASPHL